MSINGVIFYIKTFSDGLTNHNNSAVKVRYYEEKNKYQIGYAELLKIFQPKPAIVVQIRWMEIVNKVFFFYYYYNIFFLIFFLRALLLVATIFSIDVCRWLPG